jgi:hypothetical protein
MASLDDLFLSNHIETTQMQYSYPSEQIFGKWGKDLKEGPVLYIHAPANCAVWVLELY